MEDRGNLQEIREEMQQILDRIDGKLLERQQQQSEEQQTEIWSMFRSSAIIVALVAAWRWIRDKPGQLAAAGTLGTLGVVLIVGPPAFDGPEQPSIPDAHRPLPWDVMPPVDREPEPEVTASATITPEPTTEPVAGRLVLNSEPSPDMPAQPEPDESGPPEPELVPRRTQEPTPAESPEPEPEPEPEPSPSPAPSPTPEPTEPPFEENEARELCLDLDQRPVVGLGVCIRELLGLF